MAALLGLLAALVLGKLQIHVVGRRWAERIVSDSPWLAKLHNHKAATPTMGGLFVVAAILIALALTGNWTDSTLLPVAVLLVGLTGIGAWDDLRKLRCGNGLRAKQKFAAQCLVAAATMGMLYAFQTEPDHARRWLPGWGTIDLGFASLPLGVLVIVGSSNSVNLTDGLDGLAGGCLVISFAALGMIALLLGDVNPADASRVMHLPAVVVCGAACGAVLGFLIYNCHPAKVFLGDAGSLPLGGLLGLLAVSLRQELLLIVVGGVFVAEAGSVMLQVGYYKWRRRRIFLCAPLHHHFQFLGWEEASIVKRFWLAAVVCAVAGWTGWSLSGPQSGRDTDTAGHTNASYELSLQNPGAIDR